MVLKVLGYIFLEFIFLKVYGNILSKLDLFFEYDLILFSFLMDIIR